MPRRFSLNRVPVGLLIGVLACGTPQARAVRADFETARPGTEIVEIAPTEGDADHAYYRIRFRDGTDSNVREEEWGYRRGSIGRWERFKPDSAPQP
jgi:hypothetical protein